MNDFSQSGEQKIILDYFQPPRWPYLVGCALDLGANDAVTFSNTRALINMGWSAVLVEPAKIAFRKLMENNAITGSGRVPKSFNGTPAEFHAEISGGMVTSPNGCVRCVNAAITDKDGPIDFYDSGTHLKKGDTSLLSTTRPEEMDRWKKSGEVFTKTSVRGITFATLLKETGATRFDFISIDCEGVDLAILRQIDLTAIGCQLLCVEFNQKQAQEFIAYAEGHGMKLIFRNYENLIFGRA